jgi:hypothetical protein
MPILKMHEITGVTLGFKNHLGSITNPLDLHDYVRLSSGIYYRSDYSTLVDIFQNRHIKDKTVLTIGDGLFAGKQGAAKNPSVWTTFGNQVPNSLFISTDPVAIECVMTDFLCAEIYWIDPAVDDYLRIAGSSGLGLYERGEPWGSGYNHIQYLKI